eukprot:s2783_g3.t1
MTSRFPELVVSIKLPALQIETFANRIPGGGGELALAPTASSKRFSASTEPGKRPEVSSDADLPSFPVLGCFSGLNTSGVQVFGTGVCGSQHRKKHRMASAAPAAIQDGDTSMAMSKDGGCPRQIVVSQYYHPVT